MIMPDHPKVEEEKTEEAPKKAFPKLIVFLVVGMVVMGIVALLVVRFVFTPVQEEKKPDDQPAEEAQKFYGNLFSFEEAIIVNLAETNGQRYLKVNLQLEMSEAKLEEELTARRAQLMDLIIAILSSKTIDEVSSTIGRNRLKREMIDKLNAELVTGKIINIYFTEFVIQ
jgi:flagellar protein FliL